SSDVCSSDLVGVRIGGGGPARRDRVAGSHPLDDFVERGGNEIGARRGGLRWGGLVQIVADGRIELGGGEDAARHGGHGCCPGHGCSPPFQNGTTMMRRDLKLPVPLDTRYLAVNVFVPGVRAVHKLTSEALMLPPAAPKKPTLRLSAGLRLVAPDTS